MKQIKIAKVDSYFAMETNIYQLGYCELRKKMMDKVEDQSPSKITLS